MSQKTTEFTAQITGDANGAVAALERVKARVSETAKATESANTKVANTTNLLISQSEKAAKGVASITQALYAMEAEGSAKVLALGGAVGNFADLLGPGGKAVSGIAIVTSAIVALFLQAKEKSAEARRALEADIAGLVDAADVDGLMRRARTLSEGTASKGFSDGVAARKERIRQLEQESLLAGKTNRFYQERFALITREKRELKDLEEQIERLKKAVQDLPSARAPRGLEGQAIVSTATSVEKAARDAKKAKEELDKAAKAFDDAFFASLTATQAALAEANRAIEERQAKLQEALGKESLQRKESNSELEREAQALLQGADAYEKYLVAQAQSQAVADAEKRAKEANVELTADQIQAIRSEIAERIRLNKLIEALKSLNGQNPFSLPTEEDFSKVGRLAEDLAKAASAATGIAAAFGEAGQRMANILAQSAALLTNLNRVQRAGVFTDAAGKQQNVGLTGALRGEAGASGRVDAVLGIAGVLGTGVGIVNGFLNSAKRAAEQADAMARALREAGIAAKQAVKDLTLQATGTPLERELAGLESQFRGIIKALLEAGAPATARLGGRTAVSTKPTATDVDAAIDAYETLVAEAKKAAEFEARQARISADARILEAQGRTGEAAALRQLAADEKELEEARLKGADTAKLRAAQEAEAAQREQKRLADQRKIAIDVQARRATLSGDERGAFVARQEGFASQALAEADALFAAGTITAELFNELKKVIGDELTAAIADFDAAAEAAAQRVQDDIAVRTLEAQGRSDEAEALRRQLKNQEELRNAADETVRAQLENLQLLEAVALAAAQALEEAAENRENARGRSRNRIALFDLTGADALEETLSGFGKAFEDLFANFDLTTLGGVEGAKDVLRGVFDELDKLSDDEILQRFGMTRDEVTAALLETDSGLDGLSDALKDVALTAREAAEQAAEFSDSIGIDFLRSQGRGKDADLAIAAAKRDDRIKQARSLNLGNDVIKQILAIYEADVAEINARYAPAAGPLQPDVGSVVSSGSAGPTASVRDRTRTNTTVVGDFGGLSEVTGQSLAGLLREIAINTSTRGAIVDAILGRSGVPSLAGLSFPSPNTFGVGAGNIVISGPITVQIVGASSESVAQNASAAGKAVVREIALELGRLASAEARFLGSGVA